MRALHTQTNRRRWPNAESQPASEMLLKFKISTYTQMHFFTFKSFPENSTSLANSYSLLYSETRGTPGKRNHASKVRFYISL